MRYFKDADGTYYTFGDNFTDETIASWAESEGVTLTEVTEDEYARSIFDDDAAKSSAVSRVTNSFDVALKSDLSSSADGTEYLYRMDGVVFAYTAATVADGGSFLRRATSDDQYSVGTLTAAQQATLLSDMESNLVSINSALASLTSTIEGLSLDDYDTVAEYQAALDAVVWS